VRLPGYRFAVVPHPISSDGDAALHAKAADAVRQCVDLSHGGEMRPQPRLETARLVLRPFVPGTSSPSPPCAPTPRSCATSTTGGRSRAGRPGARWRCSPATGRFAATGSGRSSRRRRRLHRPRRPLEPEGWPGLEVGWFLDRARWGHGFATEAGLAALDWAFRELDAEHLVSVIHPKNAASIRVAERLGERFERALVLEGGIEVVVYGRRRPG
jgi:hypothetical protein